MNEDDYRIRLVLKLNALIAVLNVALAKIERAMETQPSERLHAVAEKLEGTRQICLEARDRLMGNEPRPTKPAPAPRDVDSINEYQKFKKLGPITLDDVAGVDLDELSKKLQG